MIAATARARSPSCFGELLALVEDALGVRAKLCPDCANFGVNLPRKA